MSKRKPPVKQQQRIELTISGQSHTGAGVGKYEGFTVFVDRAIPGETVAATVTKVKPTYASARIEEIIHQSPDRVAPPCPIYDRCGGCQLQHLSYEAQLRYKRQLVRDNLRRIGKLTDVTIHPTIGMDEPWRYRNKAQVPFGDRKSVV